MKPLIALAIGFLLLAWGGTVLARIFAAERDDAIASAAAERTALEQYARLVLQNRLQDSLRSAEPRMDAARRDPLIPDRDLYWVEDGRRILPRASQPAEESAARAIYEGLSGELGAAREEPSPWSERLVLIAALLSALDRRDDRGVEDSFRRILTHRATHVLEADRELASQVFLLERFMAQSHPDRDLLTALIRDGLPDGRAGRIEGLQRELLAKRGRLTAEDFSALAAQIAALSGAAGVPHDDFVARAEETPVELVFDAPEDRPALAGGKWFIDRGRGVRVEVGAMVEAISEETRRGGLLAAEDRLAARIPDAAAVPIGGLEVEVVSPRWKAAEAGARARHLLKTSLAAVTLALALGLMGLGAVLQRRERRFVELKSDFVSTVSHELKTPLASVRLMAETLAERLEGVAAAKDYPARITREIDGLSFLVENILSFNRLDKGRWVLHAERVRLDEVAAAAAEDVRAGLSKAVEIAIDPSAAVEIEADPDLLRLLFANLIKNAAVHNEREPPRVAIAAKVPARRLSVEVSDNGVGIREEDRAAVFAAFYRSHRAGERRRRGSGLGLAICRQVMEAHQGSIHVARSSPDGTTFELTFPRP